MNQKKCCKSVLSVLLLCLSNMVFADYRSHETGSSFHGIAAAGLTFGGDELAEIEYEDGSSDELTGGGFLDFKIGFIYHTSPEISFQSSIGYHFDAVFASNGDGDFSRFPIDALGFYNFSDHRIGAGFTLHNSPELDAESDDTDFEINVEYDDAVGFVLEYGYKPSDEAIIALRYTDISYEVDNINNVTVDLGSDIDGSHIGLYVYLLF